MAEYIAIPKLGMNMVDATLVEWTVKEGTQVAKGDVVLLIETEKTQWEVEASTSGFVHIMVEVDTKAPVGRVVGLIAETKEDLEAVQKEPAREIFTTVTEPVEATESTKAPPIEAAPSSVAKTEEQKHIRISPLARRMAEEHMIDTTTIKGTGPDGRIVKEDIQRVIEAKEMPAPPPKSSKARVSNM
jgi:pyruvate/2-oxoglutarate dehydrogenase complex dihydrolipoamide acyltransferase (E2) component